MDKKADGSPLHTPYETEIKLLGVDFDELRERLKHVGGTCLGSVFEGNEVYDDAEGSFKAQGLLIRLRRAGDELTLTVKKDLAHKSEPGMKVREEHESRLDKPDAVRALLSAMGLQIALRYEKIRETWIMGGVQVLLDTMPFADVVEIEGHAKDVEAAITILGLSQAERSTLSYHELQRQFRQKFGMPGGDDFSFADFNPKL
jgi:adenylate cyclase class 2